MLATGKNEARVKTETLTSTLPWPSGIALIDVCPARILAHAHAQRRGGQMTREEKARWLSKLYAAVSEGKTLQCNVTDYWQDVTNGSGPNMGSPEGFWRIKPEPRECVREIRRESCVYLPADWPEGAKVRVTEILDDAVSRDEAKQ